MSKPVSNTEVEDVLASIRRLVTDDDRSKGAALNEADEAAQAPMPADERLVLTEALRVAEPPEEEITAEPETEPSFGAQADTAQVQDHDHAAEDDVAPVVAVPRPSGDGPGETDSMAFAAGIAAFLHPAHGQDEQDTRRMESDASQPQEYDTEVSGDEPSAMNLAEYKLADADSGSIPSGDADPDEAPFMHASESDTDTESVVAAFDSVREFERSDEPDRSEPEEAAREVAQDEAAPVMEAPGARAQMSLGEKIAALEEVIGRRQENWEPDGSEERAEGTVEDTSEPGPIFHHEPVDALEDVEAEEVAYDSTVAVADAASDEAADTDVLDEEALREMVAEIVRQELQGELGERITRNVRKLVRREIHRALAVQDLG